MKILFKTSFAILALFWASFVFADDTKVVSPKDFKVELNRFFASSEWNKDEKSQDKAKDSEQINESWSWNQSEDEEEEKIEKLDKEKLVKNINKLIIETYKAKFAKILDNLSVNIKWKTKEEKLKILSSVLVSTKAKISYVESWKIKMSSNKKQVLLGILYYIKDEIEDDIKEVAKEK